MKKSLLLSFLVSLPHFALASVFNEFEKMLPEQRLSMLNSSDLGESYDPSSGSLSFATTDISLPGNSALKVELRRQRNSPTDAFAGLNEFGGWSLDIPYIKGVFLSNLGTSTTYIAFNTASNRGSSWQSECTGDVTTVTGKAYDGSGLSWPIAPSEYWTGKFLHIPQEVSENLIWGKGLYQGKQVTKTNHVITSCLTRPDGGQGIVVTGPDGTRYTFDYVVDVPNGLPPPIMNDAYVRRLFVTKVEDKFANTVTYNYESGLLKSIVASDGRSITLNYTGKYLTTAVANGRTWTYTRTASNGLDEVILPDNSRWKYGGFSSGGLAVIERGQTSEQTPGHCTPKTAATTVTTFSIKTPENLTISYTLDQRYHGTYDVMPYPYGTDPLWPAFNNVHCSNRINLVRKSVMGPGIAEKVWTYSYSQNSGKYHEGLVTGNNHFGTDVGRLQNQHLTEDWSYAVAAQLSYSKPGSVISAENIKTTTVEGPSEKTIYYVDRTYESPTQDKILAVDVADKATGKLLKRVEYYYSKADQIADSCALSFMPNVTNEHPYKCIMFTNQNSSNYRVNLTQTKTILFDANNVSTTYISEKSDFDFYGYGATNKETNSFSADIRYTKQGYLHDLTHWVLGMPTATSLSATGANYSEVSRIDYVEKSVSGLYSAVLVPGNIYKFGALQKTNKEYFSDGNLKRVEYPNVNQWVEYANYKRGLPQTIQSPQSLSASPQSAYIVVDDNGWKRRITDFKGNVTSYDYDSVGRLTGVTPANTQWQPTVLAYSFTTGMDGTVGVEVGMQTQKITKGNYQKVVYYDGLLRPVVTKEEDVTNSATRRYQYNRYDISNNLLFAAYPSSTSGETKGVSSSYDALNRKTGTSRDTSFGLVQMNTIYLSNNRRQTSDAKSNWTTTTFLAFGEPAYDKALVITSPESITTTLKYNLYGNVESVSKGGLTEYSVYDTYQNLCKKVRPDIGGTAFYTNTYNQLEWTAQGPSVDTSTTSCDFVVDAAAKTINSYDNIGNIRTISYGDSTPTKTYTYDKNNNLTNLDFNGVSQVYAYDDLNHLTQETTTIGGVSRAFTYGYTNLGDLDTIVYPTGHKIYFAPNALGQAQVVYNGSDKIYYANYVQYHPSGAIKSYTYGNGLNYNLQQNIQQSPNNISVTNSGGTVMSGMTYGYDNNLQVSSITDNQSSAYNLGITYDGVGRLKTATGNWGSGTFYYDSIGNITSYNLGSFSLTYQYDNTNRLSKVTGSKAYDFSYDARGNVSKNTTTANSLVYNLANQVASVGTTAYVYDGHNRRVKKQNTSGSEIFLYSKAGTLLHTQKADSSKLNYIYLANNLIAKDVTTTTTAVPTPPAVTPPPSNPPSQQPPTVSISCNPCDASQSIMNHAVVSVPVTISALCTGACTIKWFYTGDSIFSYDANTTSNTFSNFCGYSFSFAAQIWVTVTDSATGLVTTSAKKPVSMRCN